MSWGYTGISDCPWQPKPLACKHRVTYQDANEMIRLRREGLTLEAIASQFRVSRNTVRYHLVKMLNEREHALHSLDCKRKGRLPVTKTERNLQIVQMRRQGQAIRDIAAAVGITPAVVCEICNRHMPVEETEALIGQST